jgi:hydrogenase maturation protease
MNRAPVDQIVHALLYEGYILYPYRPSVKNRQRWTFGGLYPQSYSAAQGGTDPSTMQTECLVEGRPETTLSATVRFLHLTRRQLGELTAPVQEWSPGFVPDFRPVDSVTVDGVPWYSWQESVERSVDAGSATLGDCHGRSTRFDFPASRVAEPLRSAAGEIAGIILREQEPLRGRIELSIEAMGDGLFKVRLRVVNETPLQDAGQRTRDEALLRSLISTHAILAVEGGTFVSLIDPPDNRRQAVAECRNQGTWPVLVGQPGQRDTMLSSPIILYDYPQVAPESPGDLFDATEIDEILTLRVMTLTDEEKRAAAAVDERVRLLLQRTESLARDQLLGLHGTMRGMRPVPEEPDHE